MLDRPRRTGRLFDRKRPDPLPVLEELLDGLDFELVEPGEPSIPVSDPDDQPILDAAIAAAVDVIVTGDKHFLSLGFDRPRVLTARQFLDAYGAAAPDD